MQGSGFGVGFGFRVWASGCSCATFSPRTPVFLFSALGYLASGIWATGTSRRYIVNLGFSQSPIDPKP